MLSVLRPRERCRLPQTFVIDSLPNPQRTLARSYGYGESAGGDFLTTLPKGLSNAYDVAGTS